MRTTTTTNRYGVNSFQARITHEDIETRLMWSGAVRSNQSVLYHTVFRESAPLVRGRNILTHLQLLCRQIRQYRYHIHNLLGLR